MRSRNHETGACALRRPSTRRSARAGFSLFEVLVAGAILAVAITGLSGSIVSNLALNRLNAETARAQQAARRVLESASEVNFAVVLASFDADPANDPNGAGTAPGANFAVPGLSPLANDPDGFVGQIQFPLTNVAGTMELREDFVDAALGMPRDLNGDGAPDALDHTVDYRVLPIRVRLEWRGTAGPRRMDLETILCAR